MSTELKNITEFVFQGYDNIGYSRAIGVVILSLYITMLIANTANIYFISSDKHFYQPMYFFICNLALVDMFYGSTTCPTIIGALAFGHKNISILSCLVQMFTYFFSALMESLAIAIMAFDRLIAVSNPFHYHAVMTNLRCVIITMVLWVLACTIAYLVSVDIFYLPFCQSNLKNIFCDSGTVLWATCVDTGPYFEIITIASYFCNATTVSFIFLSYLYIFIVIAKMPSADEKKKALSTCISHLIVIVCYYVPTIAVQFLHQIGIVLTMEGRNGLIIASIIGPAVVNPFIYCLRTKEIRSKLLKILLIG